MITTHSVDINRLIRTQEFQETRASTASSGPAWVTNPFLDQVNTAPLNTEGSNPEVGLSFKLSVTSDSVSLTETKEGKSRTFLLSFSQKLLQLNGRKASSDEFTLLSTRLKLWGVWLLKQNPDSNVGHCCIKLSKDLQLPAPQTTSSTFSLSEKIGHLKDMIASVFGNLKNVFITNQKLVNPEQATVYGLSIEEIKTLLVERSTVNKTKVEFTHTPPSLKLNEQPITSTGLDWFFQRLERIGQDLVQQRAEVYTQ